MGDICIESGAEVPRKMTQLEKQPDPAMMMEKALKRIDEMCHKAYERGYIHGHQRGFEAGVAAAMGSIPADTDKNNA